MTAPAPSPRLPLRAARRALPLLALVALGACHDPDVEPLPDTDVDSDDGVCDAVVVSTTPSADATDWYWRDPLVVVVDEATDAYAVQLVDDSGAELPIVVTPDATGLRLEVTVPDGLRPATRHTLRVTDCVATTEVAFTTSDLGLPVDGGVETLNDRTWMLDLVHAEWVQPGGFGPLIAGFFNLPALVGTTFVDESSIDLLGALGEPGAGVIVQDPSYPTWDIPQADFSDAPWFTTQADRVVWVINEWAVPIEDFALAGTFAPDGATIGGMVLTGVMDSRELGAAINEPDDEAAICELVAELGVACIPCADTQPYCITIEVRSMLGIEQPGVVIQPVAAP